MNGKIIIRLICIVFLLTILPVSAHALTPAQIFNKVKDSIVVVLTFDAQGEPKSQGSGVILPSGKVATNCHVIEGATSYRVGRGKEFVPATLYGADSDKDIGLLDAKGIQGKPVQLGKAADLKVGDSVYAVGVPRGFELGFELSLSDGIVAQLRDGPAPFIQTTAAISHGSSGGGLFNAEGHLVGLTSGSFEGGQSLNFAVPVEWIGQVKPGSKPTTERRNHIEWLKEAIALDTAKDLQGLLDWCLKWTKSESKDAIAWYHLGVTYYDLNRYNDATEAYHQAIRIDPEYASAWINLGSSYYNLNRYDDAIKAYSQAIRILPGDTIGVHDAWYNIANAYGYLNRYNDAIDAYRKAIRINPGDSKAWTNLGSIYNDVFRFTDAIEVCRQAIRINPGDSKAWYQLGDAYRLSGNRTGALDAVRELRRLSPELADKLFNLIEFDASEGGKGK